MSTWLVSYACARFAASQERLCASAIRYGVDVVRAWNRAALVRTAFYQTNRALLDLPRGNGFFLWKPFIILQALEEMADGDVLVYADSGIDITGDLSPLRALCVDAGGLLLFAGHYDDVGGPGPNVCRKWTKRDCFVLMEADEPRFHEARLLDASFVVLQKTPRTQAFVDEWLRHCRDGRRLTDAPNTCGLPNLPGFIEHRYDQSILSVLAVRDGLPIYRHPSQYGEPVKDRPEYRNSPYPTVLDHHRRGLSFVQLWLSRWTPRASAGRGRPLLVGRGVAFNRCAAALLRHGGDGVDLLPGDGALDPDEDLRAALASHANGGARPRVDVLGTPEDASPDDRVRDPGDPSVIVYCAERPNWYDILALQQRCAADGRPFVAGTVVGDRSYAGPLIEPPGPGCWLCAVIRVIAGDAPDGATLARLRVDAAASAQTVWPSAETLALGRALGASMADEIVAWRARAGTPPDRRGRDMRVTRAAGGRAIAIDTATDAASACVGLCDAVGAAQAAQAAPAASA